jgi:hypothetical protein
MLFMPACFAGLAFFSARRAAVMLRAIFLTAAIIGVLAGSASAQTDNAYTFYRLTPQSTWQQGCFAPCVCAATESSPIAGTFWLLPATSNGEYDVYLLGDVRWVVTTSSQQLHLNGQGQYFVRRTGEPTQQLLLDLQTDGGEFVRYDSGVVAGAAQLPTIDLTIAVNAQFCFDTVIHVAAAPAVRAAVCRLGGEATWRQDCIGACTCAQGAATAITGIFLLNPLDSGPAYTTYAVTDVDWLVQAADGVRRITGSGTYQVGGESVLTQRLQLDLRTNAGPVEHFDSGFVAGGSEFPSLDVTLNANDQVCVDTAIHVSAKPAGDFNLDGAVDSTDLAWFQACLTGMGGVHPDPACRTADLDDDGDVDQADFGVFQRCGTAPGAWIDPACAR